MTVLPDPDYQPLEFAERYYIQTAKNAIESLTHIVEELGSNEDEAITRRADRHGDDDQGSLRFAYDPATMMLELTGDGLGMTAEAMRERLGRVGESPESTSKRSFFHRGVREVFLAMGGGEVTSIGQLPSGEQVLSQAVFDPNKGMAIVIQDRSVTNVDRDELGMTDTGTRVRVPVRRFALKKPKQFEFGAIESQVRDCVGLRVVLTDPNRTVTLKFGNEPPRVLRFEYPNGEDLVAPKAVEIDGHATTLWAGITEKPIKGATRRRTRRNGILVRGERAAYEVSLGETLRNHPAMARVFGELRIDEIEAMQREADQQADDESQLIYKTDRSGLNPEHRFVEAIHEFIDSTLTPLIADLDANEVKKKVSPDMRRQLQKLAREINQVLNDAHVEDVDDPGGDPTDETEPSDDQPDPPPPPPPAPRVVEDGIDFAYDRIFLEAGRSRTVKVWFDSSKIPVGTSIRIDSSPDDMITATTLSRTDVPEPGADGVAEVDLTLMATRPRFRYTFDSLGRAGSLARSFRRTSTGRLGARCGIRPQASCAFSSVVLSSPTLLRPLRGMGWMSGSIRSTVNLWWRACEKPLSGRQRRGVPRWSGTSYRRTSGRTRTGSTGSCRPRSRSWTTCFAASS